MSLKYTNILLPPLPTHTCVFAAHNTQELYSDIFSFQSSVHSL